jgi:putative NIF3 family GTP cyclohydrolase 1 type 2
MKAKDIMREVITPGWLDVHSSWTVDCLKIGDPECEVKKIATTLTATPDVIKAVGEWGEDLLIVHEPTFYNHVDEFDGGSRLSVMKRELNALVWLGVPIGMLMGLITTLINWM